MTKTTRRSLLIGAGSALTGVVMPAAARAQDMRLADLRGSLDAVDLGMRPGAGDDQSRALSDILDRASTERKPVFLPPGAYAVSNLNLPEFVHLSGVPGATRLVYGGAGHLMMADNAQSIRLSGMTIDGANRWLDDYAQATIQISRTGSVVIEDCDIAGSRKHALMFEACGGSVMNSRISGAALAAIYSVEGLGLRIADNDILDCANGGILIHRWTPGYDGSLVTGNRIARIASQAGGTGQNGNGINVYRADNVLIANNTLTGCAFSAIRSNSGTDIQIVGNQCHDSGETAIYSEFSFQGAVIANNLVDGAANGISVANFNEGGRLATINGNVIRNLSTEGPYVPDGFGFGWGIGVEADTAVTGNVIDEAPRAGILMGWGPYLRGVAATGNVVRNSALGVAVSVVDGVQGILINNNIFQNTLRGAVVGHRWSERVTGDLTQEGADAFDELTVSGNTVV
ncbi:TIGR03808 family TAT-translocated repetitive protein [Hoeflea prorocentri]|uniref:TIGR03808 family TAT-translocated repetitive protein n=1 Tax=Hoeflea prorocentri TaxID=1922333 RepID=A0A9X3ZHP7_9HYPH|nr:TIGR03808 family TAT-translocated repetitive protein [Hoeflea prorocentri]MCY6381569.1 TIGR03808 family TAT-translocated repetitive protein [Hoeflea prorocentri]MDA5399369.1 TIGR03808 family TAT-translocated repetitive protein [Hoeflea prorocentri]